MRLTLISRWREPGHWLVSSRVNLSDVMLLLGRCKISKKTTTRRPVGARRKRPAADLPGTPVMCAGARTDSWSGLTGSGMTRAPAEIGEMFFPRAISERVLMRFSFYFSKAGSCAVIKKKSNNQSELGFLYQPASLLVRIDVGVSM